MHDLSDFDEFKNIDGLRVRRDSKHFEKRRPWGGKYMSNHEDEEMKRTEFGIDDYRQLNECKIHLKKQKLEITELFNIINSILKPAESEQLDK
jgi:hypothetical protein